MKGERDRITIADAARLTGASQRVLRQAVKAGLLESVNPGGHPRFRLADVERALRVIEAAAAKARSERATAAARARWRRAG